MLDSILTNIQGLAEVSASGIPGQDKGLHAFFGALITGAGVFVARCINKKLEERRVPPFPSYFVGPVLTFAIQTMWENWEKVVASQQAGYSAGASGEPMRDTIATMAGAAAYLVVDYFFIRKSRFNF